MRACGRAGRRSCVRVRMCVWRAVGRAVCVCVCPSGDWSPHSFLTLSYITSHACTGRSKAGPKISLKALWLPSQNLSCSLPPLNHSPSLHEQSQSAIESLPKVSQKHRHKVAEIIATFRGAEESPESRRNNCRFFGVSAFSNRRCQVYHCSGELARTTFAEYVYEIVTVTWQGTSNSLRIV